MTDSLGRELRRGEARILTTSEQAGDIVRAGYLRLDADRVSERLDRVMDRIRVAGGRLENDPDVLITITEGLALSPADRMRFRVDAYAFVEGRLDAREFVHRTVERQTGYTAEMMVGRSMGERVDAV